jgi:hypothetical protein
VHTIKHSWFLLSCTIIATHTHSTDVENKIAQNHIAAVGASITAAVGK